jgi:hypothetical protein
MLNMRSKSVAIPLIRQPNWYLIAAILFLLVTSVFIVSKWGSRHFVDGVPADVSIVHVLRSGTGGSNVGIFAMRDGVFYKDTTEVGFLSLSLRCKQHRGVLPKESSIERIKLLVDSPEFQEFATGHPVGSVGSTSESWFIQARLGKQFRCASLSAEDARRSSTFQPLLLWFNDVSALKPPAGEEERYMTCGDSASDYFENWCSADK